MRQKVSFTVVLILCILNWVYAQAPQANQTAVWPFMCEQYAFSGIVEVQISITPKGGTLKLAVESASSSSTIAGTTYLFLKNNTVITCLDKNKRSIDGTKIVSYFDLNAQEMKQLQFNRIDYIHFNIKGNSRIFSGQLGNFTALNKRSFFGKDTPGNPNYFDTALAIKALY